MQSTVNSVIGQSDNSKVGALTIIVWEHVTSFWQASVAVQVRTIVPPQTASDEFSGTCTMTAVTGSAQFESAITVTGDGTSLMQSTVNSVIGQPDNAKVGALTVIVWEHDTSFWQASVAVQVRTIVPPQAASDEFSGTCTMTAVTGSAQLEFPVTVTGDGISLMQSTVSNLLGQPDNAKVGGLTVIVWEHDTSFWQASEAVQVRTIVPPQAASDASDGT
jgi:hypothetical protein